MLLRAFNANRSSSNAAAAAVAASSVTIRFVELLAFSGFLLIVTFSRGGGAVTTTSSPMLTGTDLYCYECQESYDSSFDPSQAPCLNNLSQLTIRQCSAPDRYCQVMRETYDLYGTVISISRGCVEQCPYGCYYHNYGSSSIVCVSCCNNATGCNTGNTAARWSKARHPLVDVVGFASAVVVVMLTWEKRWRCV